VNSLIHRNPVIPIELAAILAMGALHFWLAANSSTLKMGTISPGFRSRGGLAMAYLRFALDPRNAREAR
jgi:hypothetical protein